MRAAGDPSQIPAAPARELTALSRFCSWILGGERTGGSGKRVEKEGSGRKGRPLGEGKTRGWGKRKGREEGKEGGKEKIPYGNLFFSLPAMPIFYCIA